MPESIPHDATAERLRQILEAWRERTSRTLRIARNLAIRWLENAPRIGIDPDVCVLEPPPPNADDLNSLCLWKPGHRAPPLCFEIVSVNHPHKDYTEIQDRYAALGTRELIVFDPLMVGPKAFGGPIALQMWTRDSVGIFERTYTGEGPVYSEVLKAWLIANDRNLDISDDPSGEKRWLTAKAQAEARSERAQAEAERAQAEAERAQAEAERERSAREDLERRLAALEAKNFTR